MDNFSVQNLLQEQKEFAEIPQVEYSANLAFIIKTLIYKSLTWTSVLSLD